MHGIDHVRQAYRTIAETDAWVNQIDMEALLPGTHQFEHFIIGKMVVIRIEKSPQNKVTVFCDNQEVAREADRGPYRTTASLTLHPSGEIIQVGGPDKMSLYASHLIQLDNIYNRLAAYNSDSDINNLLNALPAGSGKTFIQALWFLCLKVSHVSGIFAMPQKLLEQFKRDLKRLLPNTLLDNLPAADSHLIQALDQVDCEHKQIIVPAEELLDDWYAEIEALKSPVVLSLDEQHLFMVQEVRKLKIIQMVEKNWMLSYTATPDKKTYQLAGEKPIATMSSIEKEKNGQGSIPIFVADHARTIGDKLGEAGGTIRQRVSLAMANMFQPPISSAILNVMERLPTMVFFDKKKRMRRPSGDKILLIIDDGDELINLNNYLRARKNHHNASQIFHKTNVAHELKFDENMPIDVYQDGNKRGRGLLYRAFKQEVRHCSTENGINYCAIDHPEKEINKQYLCFLNEQYQSKMRSSGHDPDENLKMMYDQIEMNVYQGLLEFLLRHVTGLSTIDLNKLRSTCDGGKHLMTLCETKFKNTEITQADYERLLRFDKDKNRKGIDDAGASQVAEILTLMTDKIKALANEEDSVKKSGILWNICENNALHPYWLNDLGMSNHEKLKAYSATHAALYLVDHVNGGMPFTHYEESYQTMYENGMLKETAKKRPHDLMEELNTLSYEYFYEPVAAHYKVNDKLVGPETAETIADNYFLQGLVALYATNKKTEGFNDENLATVIQVVPDDADSLNNPEKIIQGAGRCRGFDPEKAPVVIHAYGEKVVPSYELTQLEKENIYPEYFMGLDRYKKHFIQAEGDALINKMVRWYEDRARRGEKPNNLKMTQALLTAINECLRPINNLNSHDLDLTRKQAKELFADIRQGIALRLKKIRKARGMTRLSRWVGTLLSLGARALYVANNLVTNIKLTFIRITNAAKRFFHIGSPNAVDSVYAKVVQSATFSEMVKCGIVMMEANKTINMEMEKTKQNISKHQSSVMNAESKQKINAIFRKKIMPAFKKTLPPEKHADFEDACRQYEGFIELYEKRRDDFENAASAAFEISLTASYHILRDIPGLADLSKDDMRHPGNLIHEKVDHLKQLASKLMVEEVHRYLKSDIFKEHFRANLASHDVDEVIRVIRDDNNSEELRGIIQQCHEETKQANEKERVTVAMERLRRFVKGKNNDITMELILSKNRFNEFFMRHFAPLATTFFSENTQFVVMDAMSQYKDWFSVFEKYQPDIEKIKQAETEAEKLQAMQSLLPDMLSCLEEEELLPEGYLRQCERDLLKASERHAQQLRVFLQTADRKTVARHYGRAAWSQVKAWAPPVMGIDPPLRPSMREQVKRSVLAEKLHDPYFISLVEPFFIASHLERLKKSLAETDTCYDLAGTLLAMNGQEDAAKVACNVVEKLNERLTSKKEEPICLLDASVKQSMAALNEVINATNHIKNDMGDIMTFDAKYQHRKKIEDDLKAAFKDIHWMDYFYHDDGRPVAESEKDDFDKVLTQLASQLIKRVIASKDQLVSVDEVNRLTLACLKPLYREKVITLTELVEKGRQELMDMAAEVSELVDMEVINSIMKEMAMPILKSDSFQSIVSTILGKLTKRDIVIFLSVLPEGKGDAGLDVQKEAEAILELLKLIAEKKYTRIINNYFKLTAQDISSFISGANENLKTIRGVKLFEWLSRIAKEIHNCHLYYNDYCLDGIGEAPMPKLVESVSKEAQSVRFRQSSAVHQDILNLLFVDGVAKSRRKFNELVNFQKRGESLFLQKLDEAVDVYQAAMSYKLVNVQGVVLDGRRALARHAAMLNGLNPLKAAAEMNHSGDTLEILFKLAQKDPFKQSVKRNLQNLTNMQPKNNEVDAKLKDLIALLQNNTLSHEARLQCCHEENRASRLKCR